MEIEAMPRSQTQTVQQAQYYISLQKHTIYYTYQAEIYIKSMK